MPEKDVLTEDTADDYELKLPDKLVHLVPLLASHYIWLDDDERKAYMYRNEFEDQKEQITIECLGGSKCRVVGGFHV
jgi:hypothetical protein